MKEEKDIEGKDITEKLRNGLTPEEVLRRLEQAIPYEPSSPEEIHPAEGIGERPLPRARKTGALAEAMEFLQRELFHGGRPSKEIERLASEAGISQSTLRRGRERLKIKPRKEGKPGEPGRWIWELRRRPEEK